MKKTRIFVMLGTVLIVSILMAIIATKYAPKAKPKLIVESLTFKPFKPTTETIEEVEFKVKNIGGAPAENVSVCLLDNGTIVNKEIILDLPQEEELPLKFDYKFASPGKHIISIKINCANNGKESNGETAATLKFDVGKNPEESLVFKTKLGNTWFATNYGGSDPVIKNGKIYVGGKNKNFFCIDSKTGKILWKFEVKNAGTYPGIHTTAVFYKENVYFGTTGTTPIETCGYVYALNCETGKKKWVFKTNSDVSSLTTYDGTIIALDGNGTLYYINADNGNLIKKIKTDMINDTLCASIKAVNGTVYLKTEQYGSVELTAIDIKTGKQKWTLRAPKINVLTAGPAIYVNGLIYLGGKYCIDAKTGKSIWINHQISLGPAALDKEIFSVTENGELYKIDLTNGSIIWKEPLEAANAPLYAKNGTLVIGTNFGNVYLISEKYGKILKKFKTNSIIITEPVLNGNFVYVVSEDGYLYCFKK